MSSAPEFNVGDKVRFTATRSTGSRASFTVKTGEVVEVGKATAVVQVRDSSGIRRGRAVVPLADLEKDDGGPNALTRALFPTRSKE